MQPLCTNNKILSPTHFVNMLELFKGTLSSWWKWWASMVKRKENSLLGFFHLVYIAVQTLRIKEKAFSLLPCYLTWAKVFLGLFSGKEREHHFMETIPIFISFKSLFKVIMCINRHQPCECWYRELNNEISAPFLFGS